MKSFGTYFLPGAIIIAFIATFLVPETCKSQTLIAPVAGVPYKLGERTRVAWTGATVGGQFVVIAWYNLSNTPSDTENIYSNLSVTSADGNTQWTPSKLSNNVHFGFQTPSTGSVSDELGPLVIYTTFSLNFNIAGITANTMWHQDTTYSISWAVPNATQYAPDWTRATLVLAVGGDTNQLITKLIADSLAGPSMLNASWHVGHTPTTRARVQVGTTDNHSLGKSPWFEIKGAATTFSHPRPGDSLYFGIPTTINWDFSDKIDGPIHVQYSLNSGATWIKIDSNLNKSARSASWTPPSGTTSNTAYVRVIADSGFISSTSGPFHVGQKPTGAVAEVLPENLFLGQNFPNPFSAGGDNGLTFIPFSLSRGVSTSLRVFDVLGRTVAQTSPSFYDAGPHTVTFDATGLQPGVYGYQLSGNVAQKMMMFVR